EQGASILGMIIILEPCSCISDEGEAGCVAFRKTVLAEAANLLENSFGELGSDPLCLHARDQPLVMTLHPSSAMPCCHVAPKLVRLPRSVICSNHCQTHNLFLEKRHSQTFLQYYLKAR